jgi:hypothetical protein
MAAQTAKERIQSAHGGADRDERIPRPMAAQTATKGFTGGGPRSPSKRSYSTPVFFCSWSCAAKRVDSSSSQEPPQVQFPSAAWA